MKKSRSGKVDLVAGPTRGAGRGIAVQLGAAGATVYIRVKQPVPAIGNEPAGDDRRDRGPGK
jgi:NAD(P)-dependent dehydrogenase (short-subunit alcohol dehydrogenase family)